MRNTSSWHSKAKAYHNNGTFQQKSDAVGKFVQVIKSACATELQDEQINSMSLVSNSCFVQGLEHNLTI